MALVDFILSRRKNTASVAKERLQIIIAERRSRDNQPDYLPQLKQDILQVICKYVKVDSDMISLQIEQKTDEISVLELNITLPDSE